MKKKLKILILGGNGFIGRQIAAKLRNRSEVIVGTRKIMKKTNMLNIRMQVMLNLNDWKQLLKGFDVVVNSVGILRERKGESYEAVHNLAVAALAQACAILNIRLIHVSALGLSDRADSGFIRSKYAGEQAILASGANATIVRPSILDGEAGYGAKWFRRVASWPVHFVMKSEGVVAPLQVTDLGEAVANLILFPANQRQTVVELGGVEIYSIPEYLSALREEKNRLPALQIYVSKVIVRMVSHIFDWFAWTPLSYGHYELMQGYNVPSINLLPKLLGRKPCVFGGTSGLLEGGMATTKS